MHKESYDRLAVIFILFFTIIIYVNSLWNVFIFDDVHTIVENVLIKDIKYAPLFFKGIYTSAPNIPQGMFRPVLLLSFVFNYFFSGLAPMGYHLINMLLHFLNGVLLYRVLQLLFYRFKTDTQNLSGYSINNDFLCIVITLLFISHPINTEAVVYITCRSDLLVSMFILLGFLNFCRGRVLLPLFLYFLALLTKETALVFGMLTAGFDLIMPVVKQENKAEAKKQLIKKIVFYSVLCLLSILYWRYRGVIFNSKLDSVFQPQRSMTANVLTQLSINFMYLALYIWPNPLSIHRTVELISSPFEFTGILTISGTLILILIIVFMRRKNPLLSFGLFWYLVCLSPKLYAKLNVLAAEHHFYLAGFGLYFIVSAFFVAGFKKVNRYLFFLAAGIIVLFSLLSWFRNYEWKDSFTLWKSTLKTNPASAVAHHNFALEYIRKGLLKEAEAELKTALGLIKGYKNMERSARENLANVYRMQGRYDEAFSELNKSKELFANDPITFQNIGVLYLDMGNPDKAEQVWKEGVKLFPYVSGLYLNLGLLYLSRNNSQEAENYLRASIKYDPDSWLSYYGLGKVLADKPDIQSAMAAYRKSINLNPANAMTRFNLSQIYFDLKNYSAALIQLKEVVRLEPGFSGAYNNLAVLYASMQPPQLALAQEYAKKALSLGYPVDKEFLKIVNTE